jgi:hypothetical protein
MSKRRCSIDGCEKSQNLVRGMCGTHYQRWRRQGDPLTGREVKPPEVRFWAKVSESPDGCWVWTGALAQGYGRFGVTKGRIVLAHRWVYEYLVGEIPEGLTIDHLCRTRACVRPDHLDPVPNAVNNLRSNNLSAINARKTHCPQGHPYDAENTRICGGSRECRECKKERLRARYRAGRAPRSGEWPGLPSSERTHCPAGHEYDETNTLIYQGRRHCRECSRERNRVYYWAQKARQMA